MAHSLLADVLELFPEITSFDTGAEGMTDARVTSTWIPESDAMIDAALRPHYDVDNYATADAALLRRLSKNLTAGALHDVIYGTSVDASSAPGEPTSGPAAWGRDARRILADIIAGTMQIATTRLTAFDIGVFGDYDDLTTDESEAEMIPRVSMSEAW
jgi:hypothetical protein